MRRLQDIANLCDESQEAVPRAILVEGGDGHLLVAFSEVFLARAKNRFGRWEEALFDGP